MQTSSELEKMSIYSSPIRIVTAASLFDGHDASINIMRRIMQDLGAEVIHLGHNRSVLEVVQAVLQEGAQAVAISSYQGGHVEYFKYIKDLLDQSGASYVKIFGGGGGVIVHEEKELLEAYGIAHIFHPDDGRRMGLEGMIQMVLDSCHYSPLAKVSDKTDQPSSASVAKLAQNSRPNRDPEKKASETEPDAFLHRDFGLFIESLERGKGSDVSLSQLLSGTAFQGLNSLIKYPDAPEPPVLGITGTGGAGKSSLVDELIQRWLNAYPEIKIAVVCVDPSKKKTGGALLGDRIRMNSLGRPGVFMRSVASRGSGTEISESLPHILAGLKGLSFDLIIAESSGIGQANTAITEYCDLSLYVMTSEFGAPSQLEKIEMLDFASYIAINKADHRGAEDAFRDVCKQYRRNKKLFESKAPLPIHLTQASHFNDLGVNDLCKDIIGGLKNIRPSSDIWSLKPLSDLIGTHKEALIPSERTHYLSEIVQTIKTYKTRTKELMTWASSLGAYSLIEKSNPESLNQKAQDQQKELLSHFTPSEEALLSKFEALRQSYAGDQFSFVVRGKEIKLALTKKSLSGLDIPKVLVPDYKDWGEQLRYLRLENVPGQFPFTAGVFPLKREGEDPGRQFAGEGPPEKTNLRFHYLSKHTEVKRLSTAFDSVTLYGADPAIRPDIFGKVGESGVSIATLDDMKTLYKGFDLCDPKTSVSMTINGPAPMILAFYFNAAIDQEVLKQETDLGRQLTASQYETIKANTLQKLRGTVQADILKEDQGQNTCIFSTEFALRMMGDVQEYFTLNGVKNFYSVSISGYHIAEAGANPITQLALTLSNAFTLVEYYLSRGMKIDDFVPNLSFFFSNGLDPEYTVIGRVARRIWAITMRDLYQGNSRSQKLKYHIQTSGRSLHAQEMDFNDIRTSLQALLAIHDNCNSLHTNAYDEAVTTPTESSVRRAQAIQLIINKEFGGTMNENPLQGSHWVEWLTDQVEEAVLEEFMRIHDRGGVLGAMETQYQRGKIQDESMHYEHLKHSGELPVVGVNTFINPATTAEGYVPPKIEMARSSQTEKQLQLDRVVAYRQKNSELTLPALVELKAVALRGENIFSSLMEAARVCSLGQMTEALYEVGGEYRRNM